MAFRFPGEASVQGEPSSSCSSSSSSSVGWPFGLRTCMLMQTPIHKETAPPPLPPALDLHQQFINMQSTFLVPFFSDADDSATSDTDSRSETTSASFFKDSRRITLGSLIGLPMDSSFRTMHMDTHYHVFTNPRRNFNFLPSCGILELLGCVRNSGSLHNLEFMEEIPQIAEGEAAAGSTSLAACLQLERSLSLGTTPSEETCVSVSAVFDEDALSTGSGSPEWRNQFVSCHSLLSDGESAEDHPSATPVSSFSAKSTARSSQSSEKMQRSSSMKSFFASICCRLEADEA